MLCSDGRQKELFGYPCGFQYLLGKVRSHINVNAITGELILLSAFTLKFYKQSLNYYFFFSKPCDCNLFVQDKL